MHFRVFSRFGLSGLALACLLAPFGFGHIRIYPAESTRGAREKYTMRVPHERKVACVRIEGEFPPELTVYDFESSRV